MPTICNKLNVKAQRKPRLTHETIKKIIKTNQVFYTDAVIQILFSMGYTSYNISQRLNDIEVLVRLVRLPQIREEETD